MSDQPEGSRTLPVNYRDMGDSTVAELLAVVEGGGVYDYDAGTSAGTVDVPAGKRVRRVSVIPGAGTATVAIAGGDTITIPAGAMFDEQIPGQVAAGADVVIGGVVASYYVAWS